MTAPRAAAAGITSRIKVMSNLDIAERRVPQDGRARLQVDGAVLDARVSTLPNIHGEKVVIRLLSRADSVPPITKIGMDEMQLEALLGTLVTPQGLILITGPTGSGKTSTLYSAIHQIKTPDRNIVTLEDPVEMQVQGITQVQVHETRRPDVRAWIAFGAAAGPGRRARRRGPRPRDRATRARSLTDRPTWCSRHCTPTRRRPR